jgi:hypothetical protein
VSSRANRFDAESVDSLLSHAVVGAEPRKPRGATALGVRVLTLVAERAFTDTWRVSVIDGPERGRELALVVVRDDASALVRERFARVAEKLRAAGAGVSGVARVRDVAPSGDAYLSDLWTAGSSKDLSALRWSLRRRLDFVGLLAQSLEELHALGIVHGCLRSENILLDDDLHPMLIEVGLATPDVFRDISAYAEFAAPEVLDGEAPNVGSDVFSFGRLLQVVAMGEVTPEMAEVIRTCLASPESRYPSAADLKRALNGIADALPEEKAPPTLPAGASSAFGASAKNSAPIARRSPSREGDAKPVMAVRCNTRRSVLERRGPLIGVAGLLAVALALGGALFLGGSDSSLRTAFALLLLLGTAAAAWLPPPSLRVHLAARLALAGSCVAFVAVVDPLAAAYRVVAQRHLRGRESERRAAIDEILRLGRDFRGVSLAGLNLSGLDLTGADLRRVDLSGAELSNSRLWGAEIDGASFEGAQLQGANLDRTRLAQAGVQGATCDAATILPAGWRCTRSQIAR